MGGVCGMYRRSDRDESNKVTATATIQQIDATARAVTLRNEKGEEDPFVVGPEVTRFNPQQTRTVTVKAVDPAAPSPTTLRGITAFIVDESAPGALSTCNGSDDDST